MTQTFFNYLLAGTLGVLFQILVIKIPALKRRSEKLNHPFRISDYLNDDWYAILGSFVSVFILIVCVDELIDIKPELAKYIKWLFVFVGFTGSSIIQSILSVTGNKLLQIMDVKSNQADGVTPPVNAGNIDGAREIEKDANAEVIKGENPSDKMGNDK